MLRDTTSRGLYVRVWPPHTSERRGGGPGPAVSKKKFGRMTTESHHEYHLRLLLNSFSTRRLSTGTCIHRM